MRSLVVGVILLGTVGVAGCASEPGGKVNWAVTPYGQVGYDEYNQFDFRLGASVTLFNSIPAPVAVPHYHRGSRTNINNTLMASPQINQSQGNTQTTSQNQTVEQYQTQTQSQSQEQEGLGGGVVQNGGGAGGNNNNCEDNDDD